ncbi:MAG: aminotransferase class I/II-fold pyridoxal phosphate-dependent enzyme [Anaerolineae bacterium]|jgi:aminotransferase|nr:aminotransferase class I/II-fold pyridoxal phosphate-dependent enzyme [Anaerolineae bacterium]
MDYSKHLSDRVLRLKPSGIRRFFDLAAQMDDVLSLSVGEPDFDTPKPIIQAGIRSLEAGETHYTGNAGRPELRKAVSLHIEKLYGVSYNPEGEVFMTVGGSEGLYLAALALLNKGDEIIIPTPCFVSYQGDAFLTDATVVEVPCKIENNFDLDPKDIEAAITPNTKVILLGFPSNPTGAVASRETLSHIAELADKHDLIVLSDEMYDQIVYDGEHVCFSTLPNMKDRTILLGGFSKDYAMTGWRIGYICGPQPLVSKMLAIHQYLIMCVSTTSQDAATVALQIGQEYVKEMVDEYRRRRDYIYERLTGMGLPMIKPAGAFYAFPNITSTGLDSLTFCEEFLKAEKVAVVPGSAFGSGGEGFVRICYASSMENIKEAMDRMERFIQSIHN